MLAADITGIAGNDIINAAEIAGGFTVDGTADDGPVRVTVNGTDYDGTASSGTFSISIPAGDLDGVPEGDLDFTAVELDGMGDPDGDTPGEATALVDTIVDAPVITGFDFTTGEITGTAEVGAEVFLSGGSSDVATDGTFSITTSSATIQVTLSAEDGSRQRERRFIRNVYDDRRGRLSLKRCWITD